MKDCLGLSPALAPGPLQILHCHTMAAPKSPSPRSSEPLLLPRTSLQSGIPAFVHDSHRDGSQAECSPACSPAPATTQHFNSRWHLHHRLWVSQNYSCGQNPGPLPPTDVELKNAGAGKGPQAPGLGDSSLQPERQT